ncbi:DUF4142 domain-containing protein [Phenylobacterium sp.]|jgi:putative membrane protein|uniref:DUF4142 domain-containing protein n=1 Tax=Phenylobacterium sp. TaxID=1871053 RepID=UPI002E350984|nr:DUF4142 domain-containing protein [Phenylobacterium sp.]HEX2558883.1 DUF4142 domain-containing protein [Phenylobacterium sp.]
MSSLRLPAVSAALLLGLAACGQQPRDQDAGAPAAQAPTPEPAVTAATVPMSAADYVAAAAAGDLYEIEAARIAQNRSQNDEVKALAKMISDDHTKSSGDLQTAASQSGQTLTIPAAMPADRQAQVEALNAATPTDFDAVWLGQQVQAHEQALALHQRYAQNGDIAQLKAFASAMAPVIQRHLDQVRQLRDRTISAPTAAAAGVPAAATPPPAAAPAAPSPAPATPPAKTAPPAK